MPLLSTRVSVRCAVLALLACVACATPIAQAPANTGGLPTGTDLRIGVDTGSGDTAVPESGGTADSASAGELGADGAVAAPDAATAAGDAVAISDTTASGDGGGVDGTIADAKPGETTATDTGVKTDAVVGPPLSTTVVKTPYATDFACAGAAGWSYDTAAAGVPAWALDATPKVPGFASAECSLNFNNGKDFACPKGALSVGGIATGPTIDASAVAAGAPLTVKFALAGGWETGDYDNLDLEVSVDDKIWTLVKTYDMPVGGKFTAVSELLDKFAGKKFRLRFRFWTKDCFANSEVGAFVDDFKITNSQCTVDKDCDDLKPCTTDKCAASKCANTVNTAPCDDDDPCTKDDKCLNGTCDGAATTAPCDDANPCTKGDTCAEGFCEGVDAEGTCNDDDPCTTGDACKFGSCDGKDKCDDANPCTTDACDGKTGKCTTTPLNEGATCSDGNACTTGDNCVGSQCTAKANAADAATCSDSDPCTTGEACKAGVCGGSKPVLCDDGDPCTVDACEKVTSFSMKCATKSGADGVACDDGQVCTAGDACKAGLCTGAQNCSAVLFTDAFDCGKDKGWKLDAPVATGTPPVPSKVGWAIDATPAVPAPKSGGCTLNFNDGTTYDVPNKTVTGSATSPIINVPASTSAVLTFWSYADMGDKNSAGYDQRFVEVLPEGSTVAVASVQLVNTDKSAAWASVAVELSMFAGQSVSIRFRFDSKDSVSNKNAGWFLDDVQIATGSAVPGAGMAKVKTAGNAFVPAHVVIPAGGSVEFTTPAQHDVVEVSNSTWDANGKTALISGFKVGFGATKVVPFKSSGVYYYVCEPHAASGMKGKITVK
ncbi:MAG: hypothetical protein EXR79_09225 [Myxococcales bacterium]|nr:hypothetical protein [Myxococcales bacterium]